MKTFNIFRTALFFIPFSLSLTGKAQNIAINTTASIADPSAILDVKSTTAGVLIPRMTTAQRNAINSSHPAVGLQVYNTDCNELNYWSGTCWLSMSKTLPNPGSVTSTPASTGFCAGATATYTVAAVTGATSYIWSVPAGATFTGQGNTSISVTFSNYSGSVCVSATDACETSGQTCLAVNVVAPIVVSAGSNLQYFNSSCSPVTIGGSPTASGGTGAYAYSWAPATGLSNSSISNPTANPTSSTTYTVTVTSGGCSATASMTFNVASGGSQTFTYTGSPQTWTVPTGVSCISIATSGAAGGAGYESGTGSAGGSGGTAYGILLVTPGSVLTINIGGQGGNATSTASGLGGVNGGGSGSYSSSSDAGGGGGGASDVMYGGTAPSNRVIVGGGGGGGGGQGNTTSTGGTGGYPGGNGFNAGAFSSSYDGSGGTLYFGGVGSTNGGSAGALGTGGTASTYGGGGGGGYYGGGGGYVGGGGGGCSYFGGMSSNTSFTNANRSGNGQVVIQW